MTDPTPEPTPEPTGSELMNELIRTKPAKWDPLAAKYRGTEPTIENTDTEETPTP